MRSNLLKRAPIAGVAAAALLAGASSAWAAELSGRSVDIGAMVPLTGKGAEWGQAAKWGLDQAMEEINAAGGIGGVPLKIIYYDTQTKESEGLTIVNKLASRDEVLAIIGPCFSSITEVMFPVLNRLQVPAISYCSAKPGLAELSEWGFRNTLTSDKQLKPVVKKWVDEYDIKKVVIIHDLEDAVSKAEGTIVLPKLLEANNVEVLDFLTYRSKDTDFSAQVTQAKSMNPDGIALGACYQQAAGIAKEMQKQGLDVPLIGGACSGAPGFIELAGDEAAEGAYMSTAAWMEDPRPKVQEFNEAIRERNGGKPFPYSAPRAYDTMMITKMCIETMGVTNKSDELQSDREKIKECWATKVKDWPGVAGYTTMNDVGDGSGGIRVLKVVDGKYVDVADD